jgi:hypothetical protein
MWSNTMILASFFRILTICYRGITRDEKRYLDASRFMPERFLDANGALIDDNPAEYVFGAGLRICPGWLSYSILLFHAELLFNKAGTLSMPLCGPLLQPCWPRSSFLLPRMTRAKWSTSPRNSRGDSPSILFPCVTLSSCHWQFYRLSSVLVFPCNISPLSHIRSELVDRLWTKL